MKHNRIFAVLLLALLIFAGVSCGKKPTATSIFPPSETPSPTSTSTPTPVLTPTAKPTPTNTPTPTSTPTDTPTPTETPTPTPDYEAMGYVRSKLTGLYVPGESVAQRPYAVMINNIEFAYPQCSISRASVVYECMEEYGITRFMCLYETYNASDKVCTRIGSIRSSRPYFAELSKDFDSILVHFGGLDHTAANRPLPDNIDGIYGTVGLGCFYRDNTLQSPHNVFLDLSSLAYVLKNTKNYRTALKTNAVFPFTCREEEEELKGGKKASKVTLNYSSYAKPYFVFNEETGTYDRYQFGAQHIDVANNEPFTFKNIIVMFANQSVLRTSNDYQQIDLGTKASGSGYYICNGLYVPITWDRSSGSTVFYDAAGKPLAVNPGKTYISVFPNRNTKGVVFE